MGMKVAYFVNILGGTMKPSKWIVFLLFLPAFFSLFGQADLTGVLNVDSIQGYEVNLTLLLTNNDTEPFEYSFPSNELCYFSIDGIPVHYASLPVVTPYSLAPGETDSFPLINTRPLSSGFHIFQAYLAIYENAEDGLPVGAPVGVEIEASQTVTIGIGSATSRLPIDFYWRSTLYECIYYANELNYTAGYVNSLTIYPAFTQQSMPTQDITVFLGHTTWDDLSNGWIPAGELTKVFDGQLDFMIAQETLEIPFQEGFYYNGHDNLVLMAFRPIPSSYGITSDPCYADPADLFRSRKACTDSYYYDPNNPPTATAAQHIAYLPKISLCLIPYAGSGIDDESSVPLLGQISHYPNPVKDGCTFMLDKACSVNGSLIIYNLKGQVVNRLPLIGKDSLVWDGKDSRGSLCPTGVYMYKNESAVKVKPGKLLIVK